MKINLDNQKTSAQAVTKICYNKETRNLDFKITCEGLKDLEKCVKIIKTYNEFDYKIINQALEDHAGIEKYYNEKNPNNGENILKFDIGREGSPVMYIKLSNFSGNTYMANGKVEEYTREMFKKDMNILAKITNVAECDFDQNGGYYVCRLWWD